MICQVFPRIEGLVLDRFRALGKQVMQHQRAGQSTKLEDLRVRAVDWAQHQAGINGEGDKNEAIAQVLIDLAKLRWRVEEDRFGIELISPRDTTGTALDISDYKEPVRNELAPQLAEQVAKASAEAHPADGRAAPLRTEAITPSHDESRSHQALRRA